MTDNTRTHIAVIADRSGSMFSIVDDMNGGLRELLNEQRKNPGKLRVDITTFDNTVELPYVNAKVKNIKHPIIAPRGGTALLDAIGKTLVNLDATLKGRKKSKRPDKVIVLIITDGGENASVEYTNATVKELVEKHQADGWEFIFLGANIDAFATAGAWGISRGSTIAYAASGEHTQNVVASASAYLTKTRSGETFDGFTEADRLAAGGA